MAETLGLGWTYRGASWFAKCVLFNEREKVTSKSVKIYRIETYLHLLALLGCSECSCSVNNKDCGHELWELIN